MCKGCRLGRFASSQGVAVDGTSREWVIHEATNQVANRLQDGSITLPGTERIEKDMCSPLRPLTQPQDGKLVAHVISREPPCLADSNRSLLKNVFENMHKSSARRPPSN